MNYMLPLSGDVSQVINPWTLWLKYLNQQAGFININNVVSSDPEMEKKIIEEVAGYGQQLGWITEVLNLLVQKLTLKHVLDDPNEKEMNTFRRLSQLIERIEELKYRSRHPKPTVREVSQMIDDIRTLKEKDRGSYDEIVSKIKDAFSDA